ncbi:MAG TPA: CehA/McbA family metallohydrolase [Pirellulales bacterium]|nr:CehA/McbA family metallohydrolase [Pirellulales bacterium]
MTCKLALFFAALAVGSPAFASETVVDTKFHHLRAGDVREWTEFAEQAEGDRLDIAFDVKAEHPPKTFRLRHRDVKQSWKLMLNDREIGRLPQDENDTVSFWPMPDELPAGPNTLAIVPAGSAPDDIQVGDMRLDDRPLDTVLNEATLEVSITEDGERIPCRLTLVDPNGSLMTLGTRSGERLAVRPGVVYTADGWARLALPAGRYTLYAGRGFEYGIDSAEVELTPGGSANSKLSISREVPTEGWVACDTHCHTLTYSGHGDATLAERLIAVAGEAIELPIATDHNLRVDYDEAARTAGLRRYFTPVAGNEVTTARLGHFNVFPLAAESPAVDADVSDWPSLFERIFSVAGARVAVLNHARDMHGGFRPFAPEHHIGVAGENLDGRALGANAMEVVNSGALQSDPMQLPRDWFGLLNRGLAIVPVGSSDSHDVARHFIGQGRTYIRCDDADPGAIDVDAVIDNLLGGRVAVSMGLLTEISLAGQFGPGDLVEMADDIDVSVCVLSPSWTRASNIVLYANGLPIREATVGVRTKGSQETGVQCQARWTLPRPKHDIYLVAVATGPGVAAPYWPIPKSYQPTSPDWQPYVIGLTGAVRLDADGVKGFTCAHDYAVRLVQAAEGDATELCRRLTDYDEAVAVQAASVWAAGGESLFDGDLADALGAAPAHVGRGFAAYTAAWRESQAARARQPQ